MEKECNSYLVGARDNTNNSKLGAASHNNDYLTSSADNAEAERPSGKAGQENFLPSKATWVFITSCMGNT